MTPLKAVIALNTEEKYLKDLKQAFPQIEFLKVNDEKQAVEQLKEAEILFGGYFTQKMFASASKLRWIQATGVGVEKILIPELVESKITVTSSGDILSSTISEHVFALALSLARNMRAFSRNQDKRKWKRNDGYLDIGIDELNGKTMGIVGLGKNGRKVAEKAKVFGMKVIATKTEKTSPTEDFVDVLVERKDLDSLLAQSDFVVLTLPLTKETERLIGEAQLKKMKNTSYLLNVGRGKIVEEAALVRALKEKWIAGAGLDVFEEEPLPKKSKLWQMGNVVLTPHVAWKTRNYTEDIVECFVNNLGHYLKNEPLDFVVDKNRGY